MRRGDAEIPLRNALRRVESAKFHPRTIPPLRPIPGTDARLRHEHWRQAHDEGQIDPLTGLRRRFSVNELAKLYRAAPSTIREGMQLARERRAALDEIAC